MNLQSEVGAAKSAGELMKMPFHKLKHPFGYRDGRFVHVDEVDSGKACDCVSPVSGELLVARKCSNKRNHFALASGGQMTASLESYFHKLAKQLIQESGELTFPCGVQL